MEYTYDNVKIDDLPVTATKINRLLGITIKGLSDSGDRTIVLTPSPLSEQQKTQLDTFMAGTNLDKIPTPVGSVYFLMDIDNIKTSLNLDFDYYPVQGGFVVHFQKALNNTEKNSVKNALAATLQLQ